MMTERQCMRPLVLCCCVETLLAENLICEALKELLGNFYTCNAA